MKKLSIAAAALIVAGSLASTPALTQDATKTEDGEDGSAARGEARNETKAKVECCADERRSETRCDEAA